MVAAKRCCRLRPARGFLPVHANGLPGTFELGLHSRKKPTDNGVQGPPEQHFCCEIITLPNAPPKGNSCHRRARSGRMLGGPLRAQPLS